MKLLVSLLLAGSALAQNPPAPEKMPAASDVVMEMNGQAWTRGQWDQFIDSLPESVLATYKSSPTEFVKQLAIIDYLTKRAEAEKFTEKDPYKIRIWLERTKMISSYFQEHTQNNTFASQEEVKAYFDKNKDRFTTVSLRMIYLAPPAAGSDMAVRAKAEDLYAQLQKGADFVKLVREHSEEPNSKGRDGDLGTLSKSDPLPEEVKAVVFNLKKGEVTKPIRVTNGFYIFRCEDLKTDKFEDVKTALETEVRQQKYMQWFDAERKKAGVKFVRPDYLK